ncbi:hypothetical protein CCR95_02900 [Thiocystis minor]|uniref:hypothetical protein n=1 Tax=Thiocystis minor TaxID=61597 RepID=UPI001914B3D4|nr:hypothetical protein [Thiocystis minor]MBK5963064.1 hypothetical protein [Thiocystis minor]
MKPIFDRLRHSRSVLNQFGFAKWFYHLSHRLLNTLFYFERLDIIVLPRDELKPLSRAPKAVLSTRWADRSDLERMQQAGTWQIDATLLGNFEQGDACLLSFVDGQLAGYTWIHSLGNPEIMPGLVISVPDQYLYNFAAFTLPKFRGQGLQSYRHRVLIADDQWRGKQGLLAFVRSTNFSSQRGQDKSGYRRIGSLWLLGAKNKYWIFASAELKRRGIRRIDAQKLRNGSDGSWYPDKAQGLK